MKMDTTMELDEVQSDADMLEEYDFSKGVRGKYVERLAAGSNIVVLAPDVAELFPASESVNEALRMLAHIAQRQVATAAKKYDTHSENVQVAENG